MDDYFSYFIENTTADAPVRKNGRFLSTKAQSELHGLGLRIVQELVVRAGGTISIDCAEGRFSITALIPAEHLRPR